MAGIPNASLSTNSRGGGVVGETCVKSTDAIDALGDFGVVVAALSCTMAANKRGAFIVLEGLDRSGKSSQCARLVQALNAGLEKPMAKGVRFPGEDSPMQDLL
jgi:polyphosphate kinase 2 (PPK2 family)